MEGELPFFDTTVENGITYYIIPAGTELYRGDIPEDNNDPLANVTGPVFFGQIEEVARIYGFPFRFRTRNEIRLLALDKSMEQIYNRASNDRTLFDGKPVKEVIPKILEDNYGYKNGIRNSEGVADKKLTRYICSIFDGYATDFMETEFEGTFHREIVICDKNQVIFEEKINISQTEEDSIFEKHRLRKLEEIRHTARKSSHKKSTEKRRNDTPGSLWENDEYDILRSAQKSARKESDEKPRNINYQDIPRLPLWEDDEEVELKFPVRTGPLFMDDTDGGSKLRKRKSSQKKQNRNKSRKTHKKGKQQKNTRKRK
jgi:hypothetical protein